jgi:hypothetical protein
MSFGAPLHHAYPLVPVDLTRSGFVVRFRDVCCIADVIFIRKHLRDSRAALTRLANDRDFVMRPTWPLVTVEDAANVVALLRESGARSVFVRPAGASPDVAALRARVAA